MDIKASNVGRQTFFLNPSETTFTGAEMGTVGSSTNLQASGIYPYAYTGTVSEHYDSHRFMSLGSSQLASGEQFAVGVFLSADNDHKNLLFQVSGHLEFTATGTNATEVLNARYFIGRTASDTITSNKSGNENQLEQVIFLPAHRSYISCGGDNGGANCHLDIETQVFGIETADAHPWVFGAIIGTTSGAMTGYYNIDLSFRKNSDVLPVFHPNGM